ncbi:MAG: aminotransferase class V-fold PLP-dependent enzyme [Leptospira sp.]|nr:aminotransferase class V-fold PLP-dependent enzyme [Leptospira sp.]
MASCKIGDMDKLTFTESYSVNKHRIWLNNAGTTPVGDIPKKAVLNYLEEYSQYSIFSPSFSYSKIKAELLDFLAEIMEVDSKNLALIHNTSEGMNFLSKGLHLKSGDKIFLLENEYPSNYYPWEHWQRKGVSIIQIPMADSPSLYFDSIKQIISDHSEPNCRSILSLSPVHWCSGIPLPMDEVSEFCKEEGVWLAIDGAQGLGNVKVTPKKWGAHFLAGSAWKWLLGPLGLGVVYVSDEALEELDPVFKGTQSVPNDLEYLPYKTAFKNTADRYEFSTPSFIDWVYWHASLKALQTLGFQYVQDSIHEMARYLCVGVESLGISHSWGMGNIYATGILSLDLNDLYTDKSSVEWKSLLYENNIVVAERMNRIRVSPHIYLNQNQMDEFLNVVSKNFKRK